MKTIFLVMAAFCSVMLSSPAWASMDCKPGLWYLDNDGNTYPQNNAAGTRTPCPENCSQASEFPGYDPDSPGSFSRNQDKLGWCTTYSSIDYICYQLKRVGYLKNTPENSKGCSAFDLEIQAFYEQNHYEFDNTVDNLIGHANGFQLTVNGRPMETRVMGNFSQNPVQHTLSDYIRVAQKYGICPEALWPSEFDQPGQGGARHILYIFMTRIIAAKEYALANPASRKDLYDLCPECRLIAPSLTRSQWAEVFNVVKAVDLNKDDFKVLKKMNELACPAEKRIKVPYGMSASGRTNDDLIRHMSQPLAIGVVSYSWRKIEPSITDGLDGHQVIVYGTVATRDLKGKPVCYYVIKSSNGPNACKAGENMRTNGVRCLDDGSYLVPGEDFLRDRDALEW